MPQRCHGRAGSAPPVRDAGKSPGRSVPRPRGSLSRVAGRGQRRAGHTGDRPGGRTCSSAAARKNRPRRRSSTPSATTRCSRSSDNTGEFLAALLIPGNAGSNTATNHIAVLDARARAGSRRLPARAPDPGPGRWRRVHEGVPRACRGPGDLPLLRPASCDRSLAVELYSPAMVATIVLALGVALISASAGLAQATLGVSGVGVAARQRVGLQTLHLPLIDHPMTPGFGRSSNPPMPSLA